MEWGEKVTLVYNSHMGKKVENHGKQQCKVHPGVQRGDSPIRDRE